jgi:hypothetical protein
MIKKIIILITIFIIIICIQNYDDYKNKNIRRTIFDKYKLPLLVSSLCGFFITFNNNNLLLYNDLSLDIKENICTPPYLHMHIEMPDF